MSSRATAWAWMQEIKYQMKFILIALADRADEFGICWPGLNWIHAKTGMSRGAIQGNIGKLVDAGLLEVTKRKRSDGSLTSNLYRLCIPADFALSKKQQRIPESDLGDSESELGSLENERHETPNYTSIETSKEGKKNKNGAVAPEGNGVIKPMDLIERWNNTFARVLPQVQYLTDVRERKLKARLKDHPDREFWDQVFINIRRSRFLTEDWHCTFDWVITNETNCIKIVEGNYDNKKGNENRQRR